MNKIIKNQLKPKWLVDNWKILSNCSADLKWDDWKFKHYSCSLPKKFELSCYYTLNKDIIGFHIVSEKHNNAYLHRYIVNRKFRCKGYSRLMWESMIKHTKAFNYKKIFWKVSVNNFSAVKFYSRVGAKTHSQEGEYLVQYINLE